MELINTLHEIFIKDKNLNISQKEDELEKYFDNTIYQIKKLVDSGDEKARYFMNYFDSNLNKTLEQKYLSAQLILATCYELGACVNRDLNKAFYWYSKLAEQGNARAQYKLGRCYGGYHHIYNLENVVEKNFKKEFYWYNKSAEQGYVLSQYSLGVCYEYGRGVKKDLKKAIYWYKLVAEKGHTLASFNLGFYYIDGLNVEVDLEKALYWFKKVFPSWTDISILQYELGEIYKGKIFDEWSIPELDGSSLEIEEDLDKSIYWYKQSTEHGNSEAQYKLGICYEHGVGVRRNLKKAFYWYKLSAEQNNLDAQCALGLCYEYGKGIEKNLKKALYLYIKLYKENYLKGKYHLASCYEYGKGIEKNLEKALYLYMELSKQECPDAQYALGLCYEYGKGVEKNFKKAYDLYNKSYPFSAEGSYHLALCCEYGIGTDKDLSYARDFYAETASDFHHPICQYKAGTFSEIDKDFEQAFYWYNKSAKQDYPDAQYKVGTFYEHGIGIDKNFKKALYWFKKASKQEHKEAKHKLEIIQNHLSNKFNILSDDINMGKRYSIYKQTNDENILNISEEKIKIKIIKELKSGLINIYNIKNLKDEEIRKIFLDTFYVAEQEINIISPWIASWIFKDKDLIDRFNYALNKGVIIKIVYGIYGNDNRATNTIKNAEKLKSLFQNKNLILKKANTHQKILLCDEKYLLEGSFNLLSFKGDYTEFDHRTESMQYQENIYYIKELRKKYFDF
ncbi:Putative beta-lactamase HcpC precursor [Clostridioides difficile]|nr:Putative beta-lactamase HcpC precursor [Clostridioides difficile]CZS03686.1 Putative beta-lactamase HcpC precursor [Clostridioides difficile]